jgi:hypothetical protein
MLNLILLLGFEQKDARPRRVSELIFETMALQRGPHQSPRRNATAAGFPASQTKEAMITMETRSAAPTKL